MIQNVTNFGENLKSISKTKDIDTKNTFWGCDTETYRDDLGRGLKSIQIWGENENHYFTSDDFTKSDDDIRFEIAKKFFDWIFEYPHDMEIAFFNMNFDVSQFLKYMVSQLGLEFWHEPLFIPKNCIQILESERQLYLVQFRKPNGRLVRMVDLANFLVGVTLNKACKDWIEKQKIEIETKKFPKKPSTPKEIEYAMMDSQLTYELFLELKKANVIEGQKTVTIAGRTMRHFKQFLKSEYCLTFDEYFYRTKDKEKIERMKAEFESELRPGNRGGICESWQTGIFENCTHIDAKSMYPTQCVRDLIPIGGLLKEKPNCAHTSIVYPYGYFELKPDKVPNVQWRTLLQCERYRYKQAYKPGDYVKDFYLDGSYPIWFDEWEIIKECYNGKDVSIAKTWYLEMTDNIVLKRYVTELYHGKNSNSGSKKLYYKYLLNSLYGKYLSRPDGVGIAYIFDDENQTWERIKVATEKQTYYYPLGSWIAM